MSDRTAVYRLYDAGDMLLYVGVARRPDVRCKHHSTHKRWWPEVSRRVLEWHESRDSALRAEAAAIRGELPRYNAVIPHADGSLRGCAVRAGVPLIARGQGAPEFRRIRMDDDLWTRLDMAAKQADPDSNRSVLLRKFARWYVGDIDDMPQRPVGRPASE